MTRLLVLLAFLFVLVPGVSAQTPLALLNPSFEAWPPTGPPTGWVLTGQRVGESGAWGVPRSCMLMPYTGLFGSNLAVGVVKVDDHNCHLAQGLDLAYWRKRTLMVGAWVYSEAAVPTRVHLSISDGSTCGGGETHAARDHPGGGRWEWMTVTRRIDEGAGQVVINLSVEGAPGWGVFDFVSIMDVTP